MNPCDPIKQQQRQDLLEAAYMADGRDSEHPMHSLYTGLAETEAYKSLVNPQPTATPST
jgi:hypothetical protein